jgi:hypothetical protein
MSDWSDGTYDAPGADSPYQIGGDTSWTPDMGDTLYSLVDIAETLIAEEVAQFGNAGQPATNVMTGLDMPGANKVAAPTNTGADANTGKNEKSIFQRIMESDRSMAAAITVGAGALKGLGEGYFTGKKQDEANKIAQQQVDINRQLAESQTALNKSKTSQDLSKFRFNTPGGLIDSAQKPFQPASQIDVTKRWRMPA